MSSAEQPWRAGDGCVIVRVRLTPKSSIESVDGVIPSAEGVAFAARVRAVPAEGEANAAVEKLIARWLEVPKSTVRVTGGAKSRIKSLTISGETDRLEQRLRAKLAPSR
ncbi:MULTISPECIES: DUF167 family protein [Hyphomicrobium]|uniref:DUF167 family protein n=1 Tax=Hyphomicrobium TaxID=81 RepID=UPI0008387790|nr:MULTISPECIES: DUF167 family protein [Hyphomicrobium]MBI1648345.1 DUF167 domain-containing protein [Hyphomicrobium sulfonivorans]MDH4983054.1 DUF167 family protein [Hyphomicrobium sp. D-2]NSL71119.1 hypothetical protein [Hyphomicrobium sulfonivorans]